MYLVKREEVKTGLRNGYTIRIIRESWVFKRGRKENQDKYSITEAPGIKCFQKDGIVGGRKDCKEFN